MSSYTRNFIAFEIISLALIALQLGHLDLWQRVVSIAAFVACAVILPKPWGDKR